MAAKIFAAYPASPTPIGDCMRGAVDKLKADLIEFHPWQQNDVCGVVLTEAMTHIVARVKKSRLKYRSFNLREHVRLSPTDAIAHTASSFGCVVPLAPDTMPDADEHNIRAAFVAGLSIGFGKATLILQDVS